MKRGLQASLIQSNEGFDLYDLVEIRYFVEQINAHLSSPKIDDYTWDISKQALQKKYGRSTQIEVVNRLIQEFEEVNKYGKYKSDLDLFIKESKLEDFLSQDGETIFVSTMHKAKGREFDNIFLLMENIALSNDEEKRLLYVAMTRAKQNLSIHLNRSFLNNMKLESIDWVVDSSRYEQPDELYLHVSHKDVWLDYFINKQWNMRNLMSGDELKIEGDTCLNQQSKE